MTPEDFLIWGGPVYTAWGGPVTHGRVRLVCPECNWTNTWLMVKEQQAPSLWLLLRMARDHLIEDHDQ